MGYVPKTKIDIEPVLQAGNTNLIENAQLASQFLSRYGDTSTYDYEFGNVDVYGTLTASTVSAVTITADYYYSGGTPLELVIENIANNFLSSGATDSFFESGVTGSMSVQLKNGLNTTTDNFGFTIGSGNTNISKYSLFWGKNNYSSGTQPVYGFVGGNLNQSLGASAYQTILNGGRNTMTGSRNSSILNGYVNQVGGGFYNSIVNGFSNLIYGNTQSTSIINGRNNVIQVTNNYSTIHNGKYNLIYNNNYYSSIFSGTLNKIHPYSRHGIVGAGSTNQIKTGYYNSIINGFSNTIENNYAATYSVHNLISGGYLNVITDSKYSSIINSKHSYLQNGNRYSSIIGGVNNTIVTGTRYSAIIGGKNLTNNYSSNVLVPGLQINALSLGGTYFLTTDSIGRVFKGSGVGSTGGSSVGPGTNTFTGGTSTFQTVNITAATLSTLTVTGNTVLSNLTATTISSGTTDLSLLFASNTSLALSNVNIGVLQNQILTKVNRSGDTMTGQLTTPAFSSTTVSATTFYSGSTPLSSLLGESNTASNLSGGIGLFSSKVGVDLQFRSLSGGSGIAVTQQTNNVTITYTGTTSSSGGGSSVGPGTNTFTAGTSTFQTVNITAATLSTLTVSGASNFGTLTASSISNSRIFIRTGTTTSSATPTINTDNIDYYFITALSGDITSFTTNLTGTPYEGQKLHISIIGTATRNITWGASFEASTVPLPTATSGTNRLDVGFIYNSSSSKWRCLATA